MIEKNKIVFHKLYFVIIDLLMIALGVIGIIGGLVQSLCFPDISWIGVVIVLGYGWLLYWCYRKDNSHIRKVLTVVIGLFFIISFVFYMGKYIEITNLIMNVIKVDSYLRFDVLFNNTFTDQSLLPIIFIMIIGCPISRLVVSLVCENTRSLLKICVFIILFLFPAFIRHPLNHLTGYCFLLFISYEFIFGYTLQYQKEQGLLRFIVLVFLSAFLFVSSIYLETNPLFQEETSIVLQNISQWFQGQNITGTSQAMDGSLPTNNVKLSSKPALKVSTNEPMDAYLKGYSLAHYDDNEWHQVTNEFTEYSSDNIMYHWLLRTGVGHKTYMSVTSLQNVKYQFFPYFTNMLETEIHDSYFSKVEGSLEMIKLYSPVDMIIESSNRMTEYNRYGEYAKKNYLDVSEELKENLIQYIEEKSVYRASMQNMIDNLSQIEIIDIVKTILFQNTSYDLNAGPLPSNKDFVEYFLFENQKGSCTHYATSAALMLRCFNIPTRFVKGYVMKKSDFVGNEATIPSYRSHAWIEVYLDGKGWIPVEMTPSSNNIDTDVTSVANMLDSLTVNQQTSPNPTTNPTTQQPQQNKPQDEHNETVQQGTIESLIKFIKPYSHYIIIISLFILFIVFYRLISYFGLKIKLYKKSYNQKVIIYYQKLKRVLRFGGAMNQEFVNLAYKAKFSQHSLNDEELAYVKKQYHIIVDDIYQKLPFYKKLIFKYIYGYK